MNALRITLLALALTTSAFACVGPAEEDAADSEGAASGPKQDSLDKPTDTKIELKAGLWHDNKLVPGEGWHVYHFNAEQDGLVAFEMQAPKNHPNLWSYIRVVEATANNEIWAGVGNKITNRCQIIVPAEKGKHYQVIITSQENSLLAAGERQKSDGPYSVAVSPVDAVFPQ